MLLPCPINTTLPLIKYFLLFAYYLKYLFAVYHPNSFSSLILRVHLFNISFFTIEKYCIVYKFYFSSKTKSVNIVSELTIYVTYLTNNTRYIHDLLKSYGIMLINFPFTLL